MDEHFTPETKTIVQSVAEAASGTIVKPRKKRRSKHDFKDGCGRVYAHRHENGGGWVADTATVAPTVFVSKTAQVFNRAKVLDRVELRGYAKICGSATVSGHVTMRGHSSIGGAAIVTDRTKVAHNAVISGSARIAGTSYIGAHCRISDSPELLHAKITDNVIIYGSPLIVRSTVGGLYANSFYRTRTMGPKLTHKLRICGQAEIIGCGIQGVVNISGRAKILDAALCRHVYTDIESPAELCISGNAHIIRGHIRAPLNLNGNVELFNSHISFDSYNHDGDIVRGLSTGRLVELDISTRDRWDETPWDRDNSPTYVRRANTPSEFAAALLNTTSRKLQRV